MTAGRNGRGVGRPRAKARTADPETPPTGDYVFEHDGGEYRLPAFTTIKSGLIRRVRKLNEAEQFYTILEEVADKDTLAAIDEMQMMELSQLMRGWQAHAAVGLGESSRSST